MAYLDGDGVGCRRFLQLLASFLNTLAITAEYAEHRAYDWRRIVHAHMQNVHGGKIKPPFFQIFGSVAP
jgi:hypothetical protein